MKTNTEALQELRNAASILLDAKSNIDAAVTMLDKTEEPPLKVEFTMDYLEKIESRLANGTAEPLFEGVVFPHFSDGEFACIKKGFPKLPKNGVSNTFKFLLEVMSTEINRVYPKPNGKRRRIYITTAFGKNGGYRPGPYMNRHAPIGVPDCNRDAGGAPASTHKRLDNNKKFGAADTNVEGLSARQVYPIANKVFKYGGVGKGTSKLIHVDYDGSGKIRRWTYK